MHTFLPLGLVTVFFTKNANEAHKLSNDEKTSTTMHEFHIRKLISIQSWAYVMKLFPCSNNHFIHFILYNANTASVEELSWHLRKVGNMIFIISMLHACETTLWVHRCEWSVEIDEIATSESSLNIDYILWTTFLLFMIPKLDCIPKNSRSHVQFQFCAVKQMEFQQIVMLHLFDFWEHYKIECDSRLIWNSILWQTNTLMNFRLPIRTHASLTLFQQLRLMMLMYRTSTNKRFMSYVIFYGSITCEADSVWKYSLMSRSELADK